MVQETEDVNARARDRNGIPESLAGHIAEVTWVCITIRIRRIPKTRCAAQILLMVRRNYDALVSGDGRRARAAGEKSVLPRYYLRHGKRTCGPSITRKGRAVSARHTAS